jgi:pimeloyl-ACP methyl ester carboxylesterase
VPPPCIPCLRGALLELHGAGVVRSNPLKLAIVLATVLLGVLLVYWAALFFWQRTLIFPAPSAAGAPARPTDAKVIWLETPTAKVEAWYLPPLVSSGARASLLLFSHGNGELIDYWPGDFEEPRRWGMAILLVEYPGYGRSGGVATQASVTATVLAAFDWARQEPSIDPARIIAYGRSVGGGAAAALAEERPVAAMILESTFTSVRAFARRYGAPQLLVRDKFDNLETVRRFQKPLLIVHGEYDQTIPVAHSRALHAAQPASELHLMPCGHNDCPRPWLILKRFLGGHQLLPPQDFTSVSSAARS